MKGLLFIILIYLVCFSALVITKIVYYYLKNLNKKGSKNPAPKIYYVTPSKTSKKKQNNPTIPIKSTIVEKEKD